MAQTRTDIGEFDGHPYVHEEVHQHRWQQSGDDIDVCFQCGDMRPTEIPLESVLQEADRVTEERGRVYGAPIDNHSCTASLVSAYLQRKYGEGHIIDAEDVCWFNVLQKISREANTPKHDNLVDVVGFVKNLDEVRKAK